MEISYDPKVNALNIKFQEGDCGKSQELAEGIILDYSTDEKIMSIEILEASERIPSETIENIKKNKSSA